MCCRDGSIWEARVVLFGRRPRLVISGNRRPDRVPPLNVVVSVVQTWEIP